MFLFWKHSETSCRETLLSGEQAIDMMELTCHRDYLRHKPNSKYVIEILTNNLAFIFVVW